MNIRKVNWNDMQELIKVYKEVYSEEPYNDVWENKILEQKFKEWFNWMNIYVAEENKKIIGFIFFNNYTWCDEKKTYVSDLGVLKEYRKKGIAKKLMKKMESVSKSLGAKTIELNVNKKTNAFKLYKSIGYEKTDFIKLEKKIR